MVLLVVWALSAAYAWAYFDRGWVPHDEGALGQSAERVLAGQLPHRDFVELYTGGLTYLHAGAFAVLGTDLRSLRVVLFLFFVALIPALYYVASRFLRPVGAGAAVLLAVVWSVPNYPASVPSWYNTFFAVFGVAAVLRHLDTGAGRWLLLAGVAGGLSVLFKITGLYYVAAILLFLVFHELEEPRSESSGSGHEASGYRILVTLCLAFFLILLLGLWLVRPDARGFVHFFLPGGAIAGFLLWREVRGSQSPAGPRFAALARTGLPFLAGMALPLALFLVPYAAAGALGDLGAGVFLRPAARFSSAAGPPPSLPLSLFSTAPLLLFLAAGLSPVPWTGAARAVTIGGLTAGLASIPDTSPAYQIFWLSVRTLAPVVAVAGVWLLLSRRAEAWPRARREQVFLVVAVTALMSLIQFPFTAPVYFLYIAPLIVLAAAALVSSFDRASRFAVGTAVAFYLVFALLFVNRSSLYLMGYRYVPDGQTAQLGLPRAHLRVHPHDRDVYRSVVAEVHNHSPGGFIYAGPDSPEVYFLTRRANPTRTLFEFLEPGAGHLDRVLRQLQARDVRVVVTNRHPDFSGALDPALQAMLARLYPDSAVFGEFVVRWRQ